MRNTESQRKKHNLRLRARRKYLDELYAAQNSLCRFCRSQCVIVANIPQQQITSQKSATVEWIDEGGYKLRGLIATIEHIKPLSEGGSNSIENLCMACAHCNQKQNMIKQQTIQRVCMRCSDPLPTNKMRNCKKCQIRMSIEWLLENGWEETAPVDSDSRHTRFIDPLDKKIHILRYACEIQKQRSPNKGESDARETSAQATQAL